MKVCPSCRGWNIRRELYTAERPVYRRSVTSQEMWWRKKVRFLQIRYFYNHLQSNYNKPIIRLRLVNIGEYFPRLRLGEYSPIFTSPSANNCLIKLIFLQEKTCLNLFKDLFFVAQDIARLGKKNTKKFNKYTKEKKSMKTLEFTRSRKNRIQPSRPQHTSVRKQQRYFSEKFELIEWY